MKGRYAITVHGGAGRWAEEKRSAALAGTLAAARAGEELLRDGRSALDAVVAATCVLEDDATFNAGTGAALNLAGEAELDACVAYGAAPQSGAVACLRAVRHPIEVARAVMEQTDHLLLSGDGATRFARAIGHPHHDPIVPERLASYERHLDELRTKGDPWLPRMAELIERYPELGYGTVGAVALDQAGALAAATSTGGVVLKLPGRIGDSPLLGAGTYCDAFTAASATGRGEVILRSLLTKSICDAASARPEDGAAAATAFWKIAERLGRDIGFIGVDANGRVLVEHGTDDLPHAWATHELTTPRAALRRERNTTG